MWSLEERLRHMSITDHKPMPEGEFVRARRVEVFTGADPPILDGRREVGDCRGEFCVELERKPGSATATTNALAMFIWRREARLQSSEADNPGFVPAVVDRPDAVERPPVIEPDLGGDSVWIWRGAEPTRQRSPMSTRPTARRRSRSRTLPDSRASFRSTVTPDIGRWRARAEAIPRGMARLLRLLPDSASPHEPRSVDPSKIAFVSLAAVAIVTLAFCWAHLRRRFSERAVAEASPIASEALQRIAALYRIGTSALG